jgi:hypothetical protein
LILYLIIDSRDRYGFENLFWATEGREIEMADTKKDWVNEPVELGILPGTRTADVGDVAYWKNVDELRKAPGVCLRNKYWLSAVKLIYSGIDNLAWLSRVHEGPNVSGRDFVDFVSKYLLPGSGLRCSSEELYGARCGLLDSNTAESGISRSGKARYLTYATGLSSEEGGYEYILPEFRRKSVVVNINKLYSAYDRSVDRLNRRISKKADFADLIYRRSIKLYGQTMEG